MFKSHLILLLVNIVLYYIVNWIVTPQFLCLHTFICVFVFLSMTVQVRSSRPGQISGKRPGLCVRLVSQQHWQHSRSAAP